MAPDDTQRVLERLEIFQKHIDGKLDELRQGQEETNVHLAMLNGDVGHLKATVAEHGRLIAQNQCGLFDLQTRVAVTEARADDASKETWWSRDKLWTLMLMLASLASLAGAIINGAR